MQIVLQLTRDCDFSCPYCYQSHRGGPGMSPDVAVRAVEWALDEGHGHVAVTFFGGEPLLERETIERTVPRLERLGRRRCALITTKISTNGSRLDESFCRFAREHLLFVSLSTDGVPAAQDVGRPARDGSPTSPLVERALEALRATRTPFATYQVITPRNVRHLARSVDWLFARGSRLLMSTLDFGASWMQGDLDRLGREYRALARRYVRWTKAGHEFHLAPFDSKITARTHPAEHRESACAAGIRQYAVDPEGYLYPCIEFLEDPAHRIGHVDHGRDRDAWRAFYRQYGGEKPAECGSCGIADRCASGCACLNFRLGGTLFRVDDLLCAHERLVTLASDRIAARLWRKRAPDFLQRQYEPRHHALHALETLFEIPTS